MRIAQEYQRLFGVILIGLASIFIDENYPVVLWGALWFILIALYSIYRHTVLFQKFRFKDKRFFLAMTSDKKQALSTRKWGIVVILLGVAWVFGAKQADISQNVYSITSYGLFAFGLSGVIRSYFPSPSTELLILRDSLELIQNGRTIRTIYQLLGVEISANQLILQHRKGKLELSDLIWSDKQKEALHTAIRKKIKKI